MHYAHVERSAAALDVAAVDAPARGADPANATVAVLLDMLDDGAAAPATAVNMGPVFFAALVAFVITEHRIRQDSCEGRTGGKKKHGDVQGVLAAVGLVRRAG